MWLTRKKISSRITIAALLLLLAILGRQKFILWQNQQNIEQQKQSLQQQADALDKKNKDLNDSLQYLNSSNFKEQVARQQLNLKKDGEAVYSFSKANVNTNSQNFNSEKTGNFQKWWEYFFQN